MLLKNKLNTFSILFAALILGVGPSITTATESTPQDSINLPILERDINILGVKLGDTLEEAKKNAVNDPADKQTIKVDECIDPVSKAKFVCQAGIFYSVPVKVAPEQKTDSSQTTSDSNKQTTTTSSSTSGDVTSMITRDVMMGMRGYRGGNVVRENSPFDTVTLHFTDSNSGNKIYAIQRVFRANANKEKQNILIDNCINQLIEKYGKPPVVDKVISTSVHMKWYYDEKGKLVTNKAEYQKFYNCMEGVCNGCPGTTVSIRVDSEKGFVSHMTQSITAHGFATAATKMTESLVKAAQENDLKKRQEDGVKAKMNL